MPEFSREGAPGFQPLPGGHPHHAQAREKQLDAVPGASLAPADRGLGGWEAPRACTAAPSLSRDPSAGWHPHPGSARLGSCCSDSVLRPQNSWVDLALSTHLPTLSPVPRPGPRIPHTDPGTPQPSTPPPQAWDLTSAHRCFPPPPHPQSPPPGSLTASQHFSNLKALTQLNVSLWDAADPSLPPTLRPAPPRRPLPGPLSRGSTCLSSRGPGLPRYPFLHPALLSPRWYPGGLRAPRGALGV